MAVAMVPVAQDSDGGGSIRSPEIHVRVVRSQAHARRDARRIRRGGGMERSSSYHVLSRTVRDGTALLDAMRVSEPGDPNAAPRPEGRVRR